MTFDLRIVGAIAKLAVDGQLPTAPVPAPVTQPKPTPPAEPTQPVPPAAPPKPFKPPANVMAPMSQIPPPVAPAAPGEAPAAPPVPGTDVASNQARNAAAQQAQRAAGAAKTQVFDWAGLAQQNHAVAPKVDLSSVGAAWQSAKGLAAAREPTAEERANMEAGVQKGLAQDATLPAGSPELASQMNAREQTLGTPELRAAMATKFKDPTLADPNTSYAEYERKMGAHLGEAKAAKIQAAIDANPQQGVGDLIKNNWQLMMIPLGLMMLTMSKGSMGKILGAMAMAGGAAGLYGRYKTLKSPEFQDYLQRKGDGMTTPAEDQKFAQPMQDFGIASKCGLVNLNDEAKNKAVQMVLNAQKGTPAPAAPAAATPPPAAAP